MHHGTLNAVRLLRALARELPDVCEISLVLFRRIVRTELTTHAEDRMMVLLRHHLGPVLHHPSFLVSVRLIKIGLIRLQGSANELLLTVGVCNTLVGVIDRGSHPLREV